MHGATIKIHMFCLFVFIQFLPVSILTVLAPNSIRISLHVCKWKGTYLSVW